MGKALNSQCLLRIITLLFTLLLFTDLGLAASQNLNLSDEMKTLIRQAESTYISKDGMTANSMANKDPMGFAQMLGATLHRQAKYMYASDGKYADQYRILRAQCKDLFAFLAKANNYRNPMDGGELSADDMMAHFIMGLGGHWNEDFIKRFGIDPSTVNLPLILADVPLPEKEYEPSARVGRRNDDKIVIGGIEADAAEKPDPTPTQVERGGVVYVNRLICPSQGRQQSVRIDSNNNPSDDIFVQCNYFQDGRLKSQAPMVGESMHGVVYGFRIRNNVYYQHSMEPYTKDTNRQYRNSVRDGICEYYALADGRPFLEFRREYKDGYRDGIDEKYAVQNGRRFLQFRIQYVNDKRHGLYENYYPNGNKQRFDQYFNGEKHGECRYWTKDGQVKRVEYYSDGDLVRQSKRDSRGRMIDYCKAANGGFTFCR